MLLITVIHDDFLVYIEPSHVDLMCFDEVLFILIVVIFLVLFSVEITLHLTLSCISKVLELSDLLVMLGINRGNVFLRDCCTLQRWLRCN